MIQKPVRSRTMFARAQKKTADKLPTYPLLIKKITAYCINAPFKRPSSVSASLVL